MDLNMPVTIVVKAPNQKIDDQTVECALGWTVKKLKQHLSDVYPSQPKEDQQRIIYSGRLLHDHLTLKDILRRDNLDAPHTVHLVCSGASSALNNSNTSLNSSKSTPDVSSVPSEASFTTPTSADGLRNRMNHVQTQPNLMAYQHPYSHLHFQQQVANDHHMNQQQMAWMQQMYAHQMAQYMQYYQQGGVPITSTPPLTPPATPPGPVPQAGAPQPPQPERPAQQNNANQQMRMNAQGGPVMDDDDEEGVRDWLDWVYVMSRAAVLFAILYFYSTFHRFLVVFGFFVILWVYNAGIFQVRRRQRRNEENQDQQQPANQQQQQEQQQQNEQVDGPEGESTETNENSTQDHPNLPPRPGVLQILFTFFRTFFTSLIPENQQLVN